MLPPRSQTAYSAGIGGSRPRGRAANTRALPGPRTRAVAAVGHRAPGGCGGGEPRRAAPGAQRALWRVLRLAARRLCRQIRRRRRRFGGVPGAEAARQGEAAQPYCNNKPAAGASEGTGTATALQPSLLCACPEHSRKWCPRQHRAAHGTPHPSWSRLPAAIAPTQGKPEAGAREAGAAGSGAAGRRTHTRTVACTITRAHSDTFSPARTQTVREGLPGGCNRRCSTLELFFPQGFLKVLMLSPCRATFLKLWVSWGAGICFVF